MGLLRNRGEGGSGGSRYRMHQHLLSIGDDYWIEDEEGRRAFRVNGKAARIRKTFVLEDAEGHEVAKIQERRLSIRDKMAIERGGHKLATVRKALIGIRDRFSIDLVNGVHLQAKGNFVDHEYEVERKGNLVARVSKRWFRARETYGIEIAPRQDTALLLAVTVCIDTLSEGRE